MEKHQPSVMKILMTDACTLFYSLFLANKLHGVEEAGRLLSAYSHRINLKREDVEVALHLASELEREGKFWDVKERRLSQVVRSVVGPSGVYKNGLIEHVDKENQNAKSNLTKDWR